MWIFSGERLNTRNDDIFVLNNDTIGVVGLGFELEMERAGTTVSTEGVALIEKSTERFRCFSVELLSGEEWNNGEDLETEHVCVYKQ